MTELIHGPVPIWQPSAEDIAVTERLLASEDELDNAYGEVYQEHCFVQEFAGIAAVGEMQRLAVAEFRLGTEIDRTKLGMGDCMSLGAYPGTGDSRAERVREGLRLILEERIKDKNQVTLDLFGAFTENGYRVEAYMPRNAKQPTQWTIKVFREGEEGEPIRVEIAPMIYAPVYGVDVGDKATLETRVEEIMQELTQ